MYKYIPFQSFYRESQGSQHLVITRGFGNNIEGELRWYQYLREFMRHVLIFHNYSDNLPKLPWCSNSHLGRSFYLLCLGVTCVLSCSLRTKSPSEILRFCLQWLFSTSQTRWMTCHLSFRGLFNPTLKYLFLNHGLQDDLKNILIAIKIFLVLSEMFKCSIELVCAAFVSWIVHGTVGFYCRLSIQAPESGMCLPMLMCKLGQIDDCLGQPRAEVVPIRALILKIPCL